MPHDKFIRGNDRLTSMLAAPDTRAAVDTIINEMDQADRDPGRPLPTTPPP